MTKTTNLIREFLEEWPDAEFGPAHIVLSDDNLEDGCITWCVALCKAALSGQASDLQNPTEMRPQLQVDTMTFKDVESGDLKLMEAVNWYRDHDREELTATVAFLEQLLTIPEAERE